MRASAYIKHIHTYICVYIYIHVYGDVSNIMGVKGISIGMRQLMLPKSPSIQTLGTGDIGQETKGPTTHMIQSRPEEVPT